MHPADAAAAMTMDCMLGLAVDRRDRRAPLWARAELQLVDEIEHDGAAGVAAWLVRARGDGTATLPAGTGTRLLDRFYVPEDLDEVITSVLFQLVAGLYEDAADMQVNRTTACALLREVVRPANPVPLVLDFGCGTGVAASGLLQLGRQAELIGTDLSPAMLARAAAKGETVLSIADWRRRPPRVAGAIACFVLHYGVSDADLVAIADSLLPGGTFAANYFKATARQVERLSLLLGSAGLEAASRAAIDGTRSPNLLLSFRKPQ
jgi:predicted TPR repeat methyltransferase